MWYLNLIGNVILTDAIKYNNNNNIERRDIPRYKQGFLKK